MKLPKEIKEIQGLIIIDQPVGLINWEKGIVFNGDDKLITESECAPYVARSRRFNPISEAINFVKNNTSNIALIDYSDTHGNTIILRYAERPVPSDFLIEK